MFTDKENLIAVNSLEDLGEKLDVVIPSMEDPEDRDSYKKLEKAIKEDRIFVYATEEGDYLPAIELKREVQLFNKEKTKTRIVAFKKEVTATDIEKITNAKETTRGTVLNALIANNINVSQTSFQNMRAQDSNLLTALFTLFL